MKNILLTGANGFIGRYYISQYGQLHKISTFSFLKDDFESLHVNNRDVVLHLSALVHQPKASQKEYEQVNVQNTINLALKAKANGVKHFICMSTIAVYGEGYCVLHETLTCTPVGFYGMSKLKAELVLQTLQDEQFTVSIIRAPMVYGYNAPGNIKSLIRLIEKIPILPFANIKNQRSFVYVGNLCAMIESVIEAKKGGVFLACDDTTLSTTQLIELIAKSMEKKLYLIQLPFFSKFLKWLKPSIYQRLYENLVVDNSQSKKVLEFKNPYSVEEGIRFMVQGGER